MECREFQWDANVRAARTLICQPSGSLLVGTIRARTLQSVFLARRQEFGSAYIVYCRLVVPVLSGGDVSSSLRPRSRVGKSARERTRGDSPETTSPERSASALTQDRERSLHLNDPRRASLTSMSHNHTMSLDGFVDALGAECQTDSACSPLCSSLSKSYSSCISITLYIVCRCRS